jgi:hypothetical protein
VTANSALSNAVESFKVRHPDALSAQTIEIFRLLEEHQRALDAWARLSKRGQFDPVQTLSIVIECKGLAAFNREVPFHHKRDLDRYDDLRRGVNSLMSHYKGVPTASSADGGKFSAILQEQNNRVRMSLEALEWMGSNIDRGRLAVERAYENTFPSSQKRSTKEPENQALAEQTSFHNIMSGMMVFYSGKPHDDLVAAVAAALYPAEIGADSVRKSRSRARKRAARTISDK